MLLVQDLPATYERIAADTQSLSAGVNYYETFVSFVVGK